MDPWNSTTVSTALILLASVSLGVVSNSYCLIQILRYRARVHFWHIYTNIAGAGMGCSMVLATSHLSALFDHAKLDEHHMRTLNFWEGLQMFLFQACYCLVCFSLVETAVLEKLGILNHGMEINGDRNVFVPKSFQYAIFSVQWMISLGSSACAVGGIVEMTKDVPLNETVNATVFNKTNSTLHQYEGGPSQATLFIECFNITLGIIIIFIQLVGAYETMISEQICNSASRVASLFTDSLDQTEDVPLRALRHTHTSSVVVRNQRITETQAPTTILKPARVDAPLPTVARDFRQASVCDSNVATCSPSVSPTSDGGCTVRTKESVAETLRKRLGSDWDMSEVSFDMSLPGETDDPFKKISTHSIAQSDISHSYHPTSARTTVSSMTSRRQTLNEQIVYEKSADTSGKHKNSYCASKVSHPFLASSVGSTSQIYTIEEADSPEAKDECNRLSLAPSSKSVSCSSFSTNSRRSYLSSVVSSEEISHVVKTSFVQSDDSFQTFNKSPRSSNADTKKSLINDVGASLPPLRHTRLAPGHAFKHSFAPKISKARTHEDLRSNSDFSAVNKISVSSDRSVSIPVLSKHSSCLSASMEKKTSSRADGMGHLDVTFHLQAACPTALEKVCRWDLSKDTNRGSRGSIRTGSICSNTLGNSEPYFSDPEIGHTSCEDLRSVSQIRRASSLGSLRTPLNDIINTVPNQGFPTKVRIIRPSASDQSGTKTMYGGRILARKNAIPALMMPKQAWIPDEVGSDTENDALKRNQNAGNETVKEAWSGAGESLSALKEEAKVYNLVPPEGVQRSQSVISQIDKIDIEVPVNPRVHVQVQRILCVWLLKFCLYSLCIIPFCIKISCLLNEGAQCWYENTTYGLADSLVLLWLCVIAYATIHF